MILYLIIGAIALMAFHKKATGTTTPNLQAGQSLQTISTPQASSTPVPRPVPFNKTQQTIIASSTPLSRVVDVRPTPFFYRQDYKKTLSEPVTSQSFEPVNFAPIPESIAARAGWSSGAFKTSAVTPRTVPNIVQTEVNLNAAKNNALVSDKANVFTAATEYTSVGHEEAYTSKDGIGAPIITSVEANAHLDGKVNTGQLFARLPEHVNATPATAPLANVAPAVIAPNKSVGFNPKLERIVPAIANKNVVSAIVKPTEKVIPPIYFKGITRTYGRK